MTDSPQDDGKPLLAQLQSLWRELPGLVSDRVELLSLELQRAARALAQIVALMVAVAILGVTAWLALWAGAIRLMMRAGLPWEAALLVAIGVNGLAILLAVRRVRQLLPRLALPLTQRHLMLAPDPQPHEAANDRAAA